METDYTSKNDNKIKFPFWRNLFSLFAAGAILVLTNQDFRMFFWPVKLMSIILILMVPLIVGTSYLIHKKYFNFTEEQLSERQDLLLNPNLSVLKHSVWVKISLVIFLTAVVLMLMLILISKL